MAGVAWGEDTAVVKTGAAPGLGRMAIIANVAGDEMFGVFTGSAAIVVTERALHRRAFELSADMTAGTIDKLVFTGQRESGREMVETFQAFSVCHDVEPGDCNDQYGQARRGNRQAGIVVSLLIHELHADYRMMLTSLKLLVLWQLPHCPPNCRLCTSWLRWQEVQSRDALSFPFERVVWQS